MHSELPRTIKAAAAYFLTVFAAGFALAMTRIPFLVPRFVERAAELIELPVLWALIAWAAYRLARRIPDWSRERRLAVGGKVLALMIGAESLVGLGLGDQGLVAYLASRAPVSGTVYLVGLLWFAVAPAVISPRK